MSKPLSRGREAALADCVGRLTGIVSGMLGHEDAAGVNWIHGVMDRAGIPRCGDRRFPETEDDARAVLRSVCRECAEALEDRT